MKRIIPGIAFLVIGFLGMIIPIVAAIPIAMNLKGWSGSRLWYVLFSPDFLNLKLFFCGFTIVFFLGFAILLIEWLCGKRQN